MENHEANRIIHNLETIRDVYINQDDSINIKRLNEAIEYLRSYNG